MEDSVTVKSEEDDTFLRLKYNSLFFVSETYFHAFNPYFM